MLLLLAAVAVSWPMSPPEWRCSTFGKLYIVWQNLQLSKAEARASGFSML